MAGDDPERRKRAQRREQRLTRRGRGAGKRRPRRGAICVIGMHRSGTSMVAGLLKLMGTDLGPEGNLLAPSQDNPRGYWELKPIVELNDAILTRLGGKWSAPPPLVDGWEGSESIAPLTRRARKVLWENFPKASSPWGWKDPRGSLTLPFWQQVSPGMHHVICVRNPVDVADSLTAREGGRWNAYVDTWLIYTARALTQTSGKPRLILHFEDFFEDPPGTIERLAKFAQRSERLEDPEARESLLSEIDPTLVHRRTPPMLTAEDSRVSQEAASLYLATRFAGDVERLRFAAGESSPETWAAVERLAGRLLETVEGRRVKRRGARAKRRAKSSASAVKE